MHDAGAALYRRLVGQPSRLAGRELAVPLSRRRRRKDLMSSRKRSPSDPKRSELPGSRTSARRDARTPIGAPARIAKHVFAAPIAAALAWAPIGSALAQDMMPGVDLSSPDMTSAEMTRGDVQAVLAATGGHPADLSGKRLSGLDLSGLDFTGANLRLARLNHANLSGAKLDGAVLDQAWALGANFSGASLVKASLYMSQMAGARLDGANLEEAHITADMNRARLVGARLRKADCGADMKNQSMGLMRASFKSADLTGADFAEANLTLTDLKFAKLTSANLSGAVMREADARGADLRGARFDGADVTGLDINSARIDADAAAIFDNAAHFDRAIRE